MRLRRRLAALGAQHGHTLPELITSMAILMTVMAALTGLMVSGVTAEVNMNRDFQAHTEARLGLDRLRREVHCASAATPAGPAASVTLTMPLACPTSSGSPTVTWCTVANGTGRWDLWRYVGAACSGTGQKIADHLTTQNAFNYTTTSGSLARLGVTLAVNPTPNKPERVYTLEDAIVLRNSPRSA